VTIDVRELGMDALEQLASLPSSFSVDRIFEVAARQDGYALSERSLAEPYRKDYDALESPLSWPKRFDVSKWTLFGAFAEGAIVGGAVAAFDTPGVEMLENRRDLVVLWDLRVTPSHRRRGIGSALFGAVESWARARKCSELSVETQNINVAACRFYARHGCSLAAIDPSAYSNLPMETQLIWRKPL